jgi:hypothetical protein
MKVPRPLKQYHRFMFGVDKGDQQRMHLGGFARKAHFKKWYKKSFFAILDCMLLNALVAWNLSANILHLQRSKLERYEFYEGNWSRRDRKKEQGCVRLQTCRNEEPWGYEPDLRCVQASRWCPIR